MNVVDFLIVVIVALEALRGAQLGFAKSFFSLTGFWVGLIIGAWLAPLLVRSITGEPMSRLIISLVLIFSVAFLFSVIGRNIGHRLATLTKRVRLHQLDAVLGSAFSVTIVLIVIWLVASLLSGLPYKGLNRYMQDSRIASALLHKLPPAPSVIARLPAFINPFNFPQVFIGPEPQFGSVDPATAAEVEEAKAHAALSTVRVESIGCGGLSVGSGFVASSNLVVTNAHIVAGIDNPVVYDQNGRRNAEPIYFDPVLDLAILRAEKLAGPPLTISEDTVRRGTSAVVLGYPGGGNLRAVPAGVVANVNARGRDIYSQRSVTRPVYVLQTAIQSGNSGGPLVRPDGTVIGVIFARSEVYENVGYSITGSQVSQAMNQASATPTDTGRCLNR